MQYWTEQYGEPPQSEDPTQLEQVKQLSLEYKPQMYGLEQAIGDSM